MASAVLYGCSAPRGAASSGPGETRGTGIGEAIAARLRDTASGRGDTILYEKHAWTKRARGAGTIERIPDAWAFSLPRVTELLAR